MTKKIGVSVRDELYAWAAREVEEGRAASVSALIGEGLEVLEARTQLELLVSELSAEVGELDAQDSARVDQAMRAADQAYRRRLGRGTARVA